MGSYEGWPFLFYYNLPLPEFFVFVFVYPFGGCYYFFFLQINVKTSPPTYNNNVSYSH